MNKYQYISKLIIYSFICKEIIMLYKYVQFIKKKIHLYDINCTTFGLIKRITVNPDDI